MNVHIMIPEPEHTAYYFFAVTRHFALADATLNTRIAATCQGIFASEDKPMISAHQQALREADLWEMSPVLLPIEEGPVRVRRKLARMIEADWPTPPEIQPTPARDAA